MSAGFVLTQDVKHLATWTQEHNDPPRRYPAGRFRPICGGKLRDPQSLVFPESDWEDPEMIERASKKPLCKYCRKTLDALIEIAGGAS